MPEAPAELAVRLLIFAINVARDPNYAFHHPRETDAALAAAKQLLQLPRLQTLPVQKKAATIHEIAATTGSSEAQVLANMPPAARAIYNQLLKSDPAQAREFLLQEMMASIRLMGELLSNVSKTRSEISMSFARNIRG